ncbi:TraR/DksA family transcriptional regulator [Microvirga sp. GCM10011540]|uniref:TraR/DksA family transcriptional regulator n=1 Tax=Microvirga sp. GCM10011540 TaxID=3317338 RepID=UPI0036145A91
MPPLTEQDVERCSRFRPRLLEELNELDTLLQENASATAPVQLDQQSVGRLARMDAMQVQAMAKEGERRRKVRQQKILRTLARMDEGEFGYCTDCGEEISEGRLNVDPTFHLCVACAGKAH